MGFLDGLEAVVFDLDDTLADWRGAERAAVAAVVQRHLVPLGVAPAAATAAYAAIQEENRQAFLATGRWWLARERLALLAQRLGVAPDADAVEAVFLAEARASLRLLDGADGLLRRVRAAGLRVGLLTNGPAHVQRPKLVALGLESRFDAIAISGETGAWKPEPGAFVGVLGRLGVPPQAAAMVGDHLHFDIGPARRLGMRTAWIDHEGAGAHPDADVTAPHPRGLLAHL